jgi:ATPase family associated with various cellular activities (AAA)
LTCGSAGNEIAMTNVLLLPRFYQHVRLHLWANYIELPLQPPIIGFFGRPGDGKSAQLAAALERCHVEVVRVNASDLESSLAGEPGKLVARAYTAASQAVHQGVPVALLVDDIDTTVGEWEKNTGTVNHQQVLAELMHIADKPVDPSRNRPHRVPVFVTGNNLRRLYPPLRRHGRMQTVEWRPTHQEVHDVACWLFSDLAEPGAIQELIADFSTEPLAYFAELRSALMRSHLIGHLERSPADMRALLLQRSSLHSEATGATFQVDASTLLDTARRVRKLRSEALRDFLVDEPTGATT